MKKILKPMLFLLSIAYATNTFAAAVDNNTAAVPNLPYLIEARLTESAITTLSSKIGPAQYATDYLHSANGGHSTIAFQPSIQTYNNLKPYLTNNLFVSAAKLCWSDEFNVEAVLATVYNSNNIQIVGTDPFQHMTISFANGKSAVDSNYLFECSSDNYESYTYCATHNLHITDLTCKQFDSPVMLDATLKIEY